MDIKDRVDKLTKDLKDKELVQSTAGQHGEALRKAAARKKVNLLKGDPIKPEGGSMDRKEHESKVAELNAKEMDIKPGANVDESSSNDSNLKRKLAGLDSNSASQLSKGLTSIGSTDAGSGAMNGAIQAGMMSGGNPYAMAGGALMGLLQSRENRKRQEALIRSQVIKEQQLAEQRKEAAIEGLRGDIGKAFRGASKGIVI